MRRYWLPLAAAVLTAVLSACDLRLATEVVVDGDGSGTVTVSIALDEATAADLVAAGLVPTAGLAEAAAAAPGWTVEPVEGVTAGVRLSHAFEEPEELGLLLDGLGRDLGVEDGSAWDGLSLERDVEGNLVLEGSAGVVAPTVAGAVGSEVAFDGDDLAALLAREGRRAVRHDLQVAWAGDLGAHDADRVEGDALVWELPTGELRPVRAVLVPEGGVPLVAWLSVGAVAAVAAALATVLVRRRA